MLEDSHEKAILMTRNVLWHDLYKTAMLELDPVKLHKRIAEGEQILHHHQGRLAKS